ncbi:translation initiation factor 2 [Actinoplanes sp. NPDC049316]|uniref:translation initiation factor 2 n=1 Tax=Actinoplanes sp. NPDC049316 TaxID=3154727 RepID=UPI00343BB7D2
MLEPTFPAHQPAAAHPAPDIFGPLQGGERELWRGRCAVAEYAFDEAASLPRWTLPESTEVLVTDRRIEYAHTSSDSPDDLEITSGELRWLYPQHLRVQPGSRTPGRPAVATQVQLVCGGADGSFPALVFAGGDVTEVREADRLANVIRHAIARFRVDNAEKLGLSIPQARMLSRLLIGPEFTSLHGGDGQTVSLLGALPVPRPATPAEPDQVADLYVDPALAAGLTPASDIAAADRPAATTAPSPAGWSPAAVPEPAAFPPPAAVSERAAFPPPAAVSEPAAFPPPAAVSEPAARHAADSAGTVRLPGRRPGLAADEARAQQAAAAEEAAHQAYPDLATRAAELAARVANLVSGAEEVDRSDQPTRDLSARAERVRRASARFTANSAKGKATVRRPEREPGTTQGPRR